jgi:hypothetical protein
MLDLNPDSRCSDWDSNLAPLEYKLGALAFEETWWVKLRAGEYANASFIWVPVLQSQLSFWQKPVFVFTAVSSAPPPTFTPVSHYSFVLLPDRRNVHCIVMPSSEHLLLLCLSTKNWFPCGGGFEYLHHSPASRGRRQKGNSAPLGITGPPCHGGKCIQGPDPPSRVLHARLATLLC